MRCLSGCLVLLLKYSGVRQLQVHQEVAAGTVDMTAVTLEIFIILLLLYINQASINRIEKKSVLRESR